MAKKESYTPDQILSEVRAARFRPVYLLAGEESYYIDLLTDAICQNALTDDERDFNEVILYGSDVDVRRVVDECKFFPSFAERRLVVLKEAQQMGDLDELVHYLKTPMNSSVLVINYKYGTPDGRKKWVAEASKQGVYFESKKLYDNQIPEWIGRFLAAKGIQMEAKAGMMLSNFLGTDLSKIVGELEKLMITLPQGVTRITADQVEKNIGISKDYNNFEFLRAIVNRDVERANHIVYYFDRNQKANPLVVTLTVLFNYFSNLMIACFIANKNESAVMQELNLRSSFQAKDYMMGLKNYKPMKVFDIISLLREYDAKSKGFGNASATQGELLKELTFKILH